MQETHLNAYGMIKGIKWRIHNRLKVWLLVSTKNLLGTITKQFEDEKAGMVYHLFAVMNSIAMVESLQRGFVDEEIWSSMFSHTDNKASGLDGFSTAFFPQSMVSSLEWSGGSS